MGPAWRSLLPPVAKGSSAAAPAPALRMDGPAEQLSFTPGNPKTSPHGPGGAPPENQPSGRGFSATCHLPRAPSCVTLVPSAWSTASPVWTFCTTGGAHALSRSLGPESQSPCLCSQTPLVLAQLSCPTETDQSSQLPQTLCFSTHSPSKQALRCLFGSQHPAQDLCGLWVPGTWTGGAGLEETRHRGQGPTPMGPTTWGRSSSVTPYKVPGRGRCAHAR